MIWLFGQLWEWLLLAFMVGAIVAFLAVKLTLPHQDDLESETGAEAKGLLS
jgi:uncharacterized membrane-anchored protein YhcB (DUF1043 family)